MELKTKILKIKNSLTLLDIDLRWEENVKTTGMLVKMIVSEKHREEK